MPEERMVWVALHDSEEGLEVLAVCDTEEEAKDVCAKGHEEALDWNRAYGGDRVDWIANDSSGGFFEVRPTPYVHSG